MNIFKQILTATALFICISGAASATGYHHYSQGCGPDTPSCDNLQQYNQEFTTTDFTESSHYDNKYYFDFDALVKPADNFKITSAFITLETTSNGWYDKFYAYNNNYWVGPVSISNNASTTYELSSAFFDDILAGINFKVWFSLSSENISKAILAVNGEYCPPVDVSEVPVPAAAFLFAPAMLGFMGLRRRAKKTVA